MPAAFKPHPGLRPFRDAENLDEEIQSDRGALSQPSWMEADAGGVKSSSLNALCHADDQVPPAILGMHHNRYASSC